MIPVGKYPAKVQSASLLVTRKGVEYVGINVLVHAPPAGDQPMSYNGWLSSGALPITIKALRAAGWKGDDISDLSMVKGAAVEVEIEHDEYQGRVSAKIKWLNAPGGGLGEKLPPDAAKALGKRLAASVKSIEAMDSGGPPADDADRPAPVDDDIPFILERPIVRRRGPREV